MFAMMNGNILKQCFRFYRLFILFHDLIMSELTS